MVVGLIQRESSGTATCCIVKSSNWSMDRWLYFGTCTIADWSQKLQTKTIDPCGAHPLLITIVLVKVATIDNSDFWPFLFPFVHSQNSCILSGNQKEELSIPQSVQKKLLAVPYYGERCLKVIQAMLVPTLTPLYQQKWITKWFNNNKTNVTW